MLVITSTFHLMVAHVLWEMEEFCNNLLWGEGYISYLFREELIQAMKYELYQTKLKRGCDFNCDYLTRLA